MTSIEKPKRAYEHVQRKLTEQERSALRESLATHGLRDAITLDQHGDILDGYNREDLCRELGIKPRYRVLEVDDPVHWIRHNQTARRNLGEAEMRELIVDMKTENPEASAQTIAERLGTSKATVTRTLRNTGGLDKSPVKGKDGKTYKAKPKNPANDAKLEKALHAYDRRKAAGEEITYEALMEEAGTSSMPVRRALSIRKGQEELGEQAEIILSASMQQKYEAKVRALKKTFEYEVQTRVLSDIKTHMEKYGIPNYMALLRKVEGMIEHKRGVMKRAEFRIIQRCLHPDTGQHVSDANRNEAFRLFMSLEARLVDDDKEQADLKRVSTLPRTVEEMLARKTMKRRTV
jgi:predicted transcriptional regulator